MKPPGETWEFIITSVVTSLLGLLFTIFSFFNFFGSFCGSFGRKFLFEMDEVMGGLLNLPHFSKIEGLLLLFGSTAGVICWLSEYEFCTEICLIIACMYTVICVFYGVNARQVYGPTVGLFTV